MRCPCRDGGVGEIAPGFASLMEATAIHTLIRQRPPTPLCRGLNPYCGENNEPGRYITESLTSGPELENSQGQTRK